ncbi:MAG: diaminopimelate epimerase [Mycobacteriales bacterium]
MRFTKGHGTGNDFVVLPDPDAELALTPTLVQALCDRRTGIGADGVLRAVLTAAVPEVAHHAGEARWFMDYRNADGSLAEMCGNGARVYARYLVLAGYAAPGEVLLATRSGVRRVTVPAEGEVSVDMGEPGLPGTVREVTVGGQPHQGVEVWMGNPHLVVQYDDLEGLGSRIAPPVVTPHLDANVEFVRLTGPGRLVMRVHERGVGETASCGTGACAAAVGVAAARGERAAEAVVDVPGGRLRVHWAGGSVTLTGGAELVAHGVVEESWLAALAEPVASG